MSTCSRPIYELLGNGDWFGWLQCAYTIDLLSAGGIGLFLVGIPFVGLKNWSESWTMPLVWLAIAVPMLSTALLPGVVVRRIAGLLTAGVALLVIGLYWWWGRS